MKNLFFLLLLTTSFCNAQVNLNEGLVAYYPFNGNTNEATGNGLNAIAINGPTLTTDRFGNINSAYYFDGVNDYMQIPNNSTINPSTAFSIALYFFTEKTTVQTLVGKIAFTGSTATQYQIAIDYSPIPGVLFGVNPPNNCAGVGLNATYVNTGEDTVPLNQWHCVVGSFDNGLMKIYLDGALIQTRITNFTTTNQCATATVQIGSWWSGDIQRFQGKIDDIRFYNRAITQDEVTALCSIPTALACNNWLRIPNSQSYVTVGDLDVPGTQLTVEGMFSRDSALTPAGYSSLNVVSKHWTPSDVNYLLRVDRAEITTSNGYFTTPGICETENKKVYHVAMTYDGATLKFYRNGFLMSQVACTGIMYQNSWPTTIGATAGSPTTNTTLIGYLNEIRIWNVVRTQAQLKDAMNTRLINPAIQTGLLAYYTFDDLTNKQGNATYNAVLRGNASVNQTVTNCAFVVDSCMVVTPVKIVDFATTVHNTDILLKWIVSEELGINGYEIQRSTSSSAGFTSIGNVAVNNNQPSTNYLFVDHTARANTTYYYRLLIKENTGIKKYSLIKTGRANSKSWAINIYPNPTTGNFTVQLPDYTGNAVVRIHNNTGQEISITKATFTNSNMLSTIDISKQPKGTYTIEVITNNNKSIKKLIKF